MLGFDSEVIDTLPGAAHDVPDGALYPNNNSYFICWKLLERGAASEKVVAQLPATLSEEQKGRLIFITSSGLTLTPQITGNTATLDLPPANGDESYHLHVLLPDDGKNKHLGRLDVVTRSRKTYNAVLVNLGGTADLQTMKDGLSKIYSRYGINWNLTEDTEFKTKADQALLAPNFKRRFQRGRPVHERLQEEPTGSECLV